MSYRFKAPKVIIEGDVNKIEPQTLPVSPIDGQFVIDSVDEKLKVWNVSLNRWIILGDAVNQVFSNSGNNFTAVNTQAAIEEARNTPIGKLISFSTNRTGGAGNAYTCWGESGMPSNDSPFVVPMNARIIGISASSNSGGRNYDINVNIANAGAGGTVNRSLVYQIRNGRTYTRMDWTGTDAAYNVNAGDKIGVYCQNQGAAPSDLTVTVHMQITSKANTSVTETYATSFNLTIGPIVITIG